MNSYRSCLNMAVVALFVILVATTHALPKRRGGGNNNAGDDDDFNDTILARRGGGGSGSKGCKTRTFDNPVLLRVLIEIITPIGNFPN
ncbi:hypothetical protein ElyMa_005671300 [Elysia marginata]|uniref:Secreted protein n=1 Tax=Elysia marginata TaxID=1093978 RepID=A0AAV4FCK1_9GAST|nr:hypothetical protein ElyMa_005671300 [Elysia marginata]